jgi:SAM-dependent methyltransferase
MEQTPAHDLPNPDLLAVLPAVARVVEVGCSRGALAKAVKARQPACHYLGIEIEPSFAAIASNHCDQVLVGDIESLLSSGQLGTIAAADCWVFGDTLEHLRDPWQVLRALHPLLRPGGCICACIPNMQHWSIQLQLNTGQIRYCDSGLLDRTHLRWFTRLTMLELFASSGFAVELMLPRIFPHRHAEQACQLIAQIARQIGHDPDQAIQDAQPLQYVLRARPAPASPAAAAPP